jgi:hypothetical protein
MANTTKPAARRRPTGLDQKKPADVSPAPDRWGSGIIIPHDDEDENENEVTPPGVYLEGEPVPEDRVKLFHLDGRVYTAPRKLPPNITFKFMRKMRTTDTDLATFWLVEQVLTAHVVDILADHDELTEDELDAIMKVIRRHTMGAMERSTGK